MLEALITMLVAAIIGLGLAYATVRATSAQRIMNGQNIAITQLRYQMQVATGSNCTASSTITVASTTIAATCSYASASYQVTAKNSTGTTISSGTVSVTSPSISTSASSTGATQYLGGQMTVTP